MIRFTRNSLFFTGLAVILLTYVAYKTAIILLSDNTIGLVIDYEAEGEQLSGRKHVALVNAIVVYDVGGIEYRLRNEENVQLRVGNEIPVLYRRSDPSKAYVFTFWNFWFRPILILPIMVWGVIVVGIGKNGSYWTLFLRNMRIARTELQKRRDV